MALQKALLSHSKENYSNLRQIRTFTKILSLFLLVLTILSSCKSSKKVNKDEKVIETTIQQPSKHSKEDKKDFEIGEKIVKEALTWEGTPYKYAGQTKGKGTDCSGLVMSVYQQVANIKLPRNSAQQADFCKEIKGKEVRPGDLVFFATGSNKKKVSHVGVMIDKKRFVHASGSRGVIISDMDTPYYIRCFIKYGRVPL